MSVKARLSGLVLAAAVIALPLAVAGPASAYPPGTDPVVSTAAGVFVLGAGIPATLTNAQPSCTAQFVLSGPGADVTRTATVGADATATTTFPGLSAAGSYTITSQTIATEGQTGCESAASTTSFRVTTTPTGGVETGDGATQPASDQMPLLAGGLVLIGAALTLGAVTLRRRKGAVA
jgi:hypothetical protein